MRGRCTTDGHRCLGLRVGLRLREARVVLRRSDDHVLRADFVRTWSSNGRIRHVALRSTDPRIRDDTTTAAADPWIRDDALSAADARLGRLIVGCSTVVFTSSGPTNNVAGGVRAPVEVIMWTIHVIVVVVIPAKRPADRGAMPPVPTRSHRRPTDVAVAHRSRPPNDPRACVAAPRDP